MDDDKWMAEVDGWDFLMKDIREHVRSCWHSPKAEGVDINGVVRMMHYKRN